MTKRSDIVLLSSVLIIALVFMAIVSLKFINKRNTLTESEYPQFESQSKSTDLEDIEKDIENTDFSDIDKELEEIENELDKAY